MTEHSPRGIMTVATQTRPSVAWAGLGRAFWAMREQLLVAMISSQSPFLLDKCHDLDLGGAGRTSFHPCLRKMTAYMRMGFPSL